MCRWNKKEGNRCYRISILAKWVIYHRKLKWSCFWWLWSGFYFLCLLPKSLVSTQLKNSCSDINMYRGPWSLWLIINCALADKGAGIPLDKLHKINYSLKDALSNFVQVPKHILKWCRFETHLWTPWSASSMLCVSCVFLTLTSWLLHLTQVSRQPGILQTYSLVLLLAAAGLSFKIFTRFCFSLCGPEERIFHYDGLTAAACLSLRRLP